eukprot:scaffold248687_cov22-Tisochrysis_lutea.AAC.1
MELCDNGRYFYDNGTIDFVSVRWGGVTNKLVWGQRVKRGVMSWGDYPADVEVGKWLPIFMEGVREYEVSVNFFISLSSVHKKATEIERIARQ